MPVKKPRLVPPLHAENAHQDISHSSLGNESCQSTNTANREYKVHAHYKRDEDPNVSPPIRKLDVERKVQVLVGVPGQIKLAGRGGVGVGKVTSCTRHVRAHVL